VDDYREPSLTTAYISGEAPGGACEVGWEDGVMNASYCPVDGSLAYDLNWFRGLHREFGAVAPVTVLAHEWGTTSRH